MTSKTPMAVLAAVAVVTSVTLEAQDTAVPSYVASSPLTKVLQSLPEGGWARVNTNLFQDVWAPAELRPKTYGEQPRKIIDAWSSFAWDSNRGDLLLYGGGHANYSGNEVYRWRSRTQKWERASLPSDIALIPGTAVYLPVDGADRAPSSAHTYDNSLFLPRADRFMTWGGAAFNSGTPYLRADASAEGGVRRTGPYLFDPAKANANRVGGSTGSHVKRSGSTSGIVGGNMWQNRDIYKHLAGQPLPGSHINGCTAYAQENGRDVAYVVARVGSTTQTNLYRYELVDVNNPSLDRVNVVGVYGNGTASQTSCSYDARKKLLVRTGSNGVPFQFWDLNTPGSSNKDQSVEVTGSLAVFRDWLTSRKVDIRYCALDFDPIRAHHVLWCGKGQLWALEGPSANVPYGWSIRQLPIATTEVPPGVVATGILGKWHYIPYFDAFVGLMDGQRGDVWVYKPLDWAGPSTATPTPPTGGGTPTTPPPAPGEPAPPPAPPSEPAPDHLSGPGIDQLTVPETALRLYDPDVSHEYWNRLARLKWGRAGGDWYDANGTKYGTTPYSKALVKETHTSQPVSFDATKLVKEWAAGSVPDDGIMLRIIPADSINTINFASRELGSGAAVLSIRLSSGQTLRVPVSADATLDPSTISSLGTQTTVRVGNKRSAILAFNLPALPAASSIGQATLTITSTKQYGESTIGLYRLIRPLHQVDEPAKLGIAASYPGDSGLEKHPDVLLLEDFHDEDFKGRGWHKFAAYPLPYGDIVSQADSTLGFVPLPGKKSVRVLWDPSRNGAMGSLWEFKENIGADPEEIYVRYYLMFAKDWEPTVDGGKLPGFDGRYFGTAGGGGSPSHGDDGWSARGHFLALPISSNPMRPYPVIGSQLYHVDDPNPHGEVVSWTRNGNAYLQKGKWYSIEQYFRVNSIANGRGRNDGILRTWVNGRLAYERTNLRVRDIPELKIRRIWFDMWHGGIAKPPRRMHTYVSQIVVAKRYIGPMVPKQ
jgi:hypothetical protein